DRRPRLQRDAHARRGGALVQGHAQPAGRRRRRRSRRGQQRLRPLPGDLGLAALLGVLIGLPLAHTAPWPLAIARLGAVHWLGLSASPRRAAAVGWIVGTSWLASTVWWLYISMHDYGGLLAPVAAAAVLLLSVALGLFLAAALWLFARLRSGRAAP